MPGLVIPHGRWKTACVGAMRATTAPAKSTADPRFDGNDNREVGVGSGDPPCGWRAWGGGADPPSPRCVFQNLRRALGRPREGGAGQRGASAADTNDKRWLKILMFSLQFLAAGAVFHFSQTAVSCKQ